MNTKQYWWVTRPHRKLTSIPKSLQVFASVASGESWSGNREKHVEYENMLDFVQAKRGGNYVDRIKRSGGGGGRTHAALLYSLGLYFTHYDDELSEEEVHLTLAGQAIVDQEDALPVLRKQILNYQFPSAYSVRSGVNVDRRFRLRPFVLLLKLLLRHDLGGYLTDEEIAACVVCYAERHSDTEAEKIAELIKRYRTQKKRSSRAQDWCSVLPQDWESLWQNKKGVDALLASGGKARDVGNTVALWLRFTGYAVGVPGAAVGVDARTVTALDESQKGEINEVIAQLGAPLPRMDWLEPEDKFDKKLAAVAYQRGYGLPPGKVRDNRAVGTVRKISQKDKTRGLVSHSLSHLFQTKIITAVDTELVQAVARNTGLDEHTVRTTLTSLIRTPQQGLTQFMDRYRQMAFSGTNEAINFEKATAEVFRTVFGLRSEHIGQTGRVPDIEVWSDEWLGIIDTKAYSSYRLESDHQLRMQASYLPTYRDGKYGRPLKFFMYIAGGFAPSFDPNLQKIIQASGISGSGISIGPWLELVTRYPSSNMDHSDLLALWSSGRQITFQDVAEQLT